VHGVIIPGITGKFIFKKRGSMYQLKLTGGVWFIRILSWMIWLWIVASMLIYFFIPTWTLKTTDISGIAFYLLIVSAILLNGIILSINFIVRYFGLIKPYNRGRYTPLIFSGIIRFFLLNILFWILVDIVASTGVFLFLVSNQVWPLYLWTIVSLGFMIFLAPRLKPFLNNKTE
jgi:hypothetical protein